MRNHWNPTLATTMTPKFLLSLLTILCSSHLISSIRRASDNASPIGAYLVAVRRPDGLLGFDEPEALERWHTHLLKQVCNTSDPTTSALFPTAESRLIYSYSHVVSGFSAWLTPQELERMAMYPWFVEAIPDRSYKLMTVDGPTPQLSGLDHLRDGEGVIIGVIDAGAIAGHVVFSNEAEGMQPPPAKWNGRCDHREACNNKLIGLRSFVETNRSQGAHISGAASGGFVERASALGIDYAAAFAVAPKAHLAIYHVCDERERDPKAVTTGMLAAVDDGEDVISLCIGNEDNAVFHDDAVTVPSYKAVARGVLVCTPAGSSDPYMYRVEGNAPWLLSVAASDTGRRVLTNVDLGDGILKPDVSAPGLVTTLAASPHGDVGDSDARLKATASIAAAHVSGVAAMIKKAHHDWSPAAIKSALVTTAHPPLPADAVSGDGPSYFVTGAGEVNMNPAKAMDPGLLYELTAEEFTPYLCGMKLGEDRMEKIVEPANASCAETGVIAAKDLNYPSIMIVLDDDVWQIEAKRTVTNVGESAETYSVEATARGVDVVVSPSTLVFTDSGQKMDFAVTVKRKASTPAKAVIEGELKWVSEKHAVRSPVVVVFGETAASNISYSTVDDAVHPES